MGGEKCYIIKGLKTQNNQTEYVALVWILIRKERERENRERMDRLSRI